MIAYNLIVTRGYIDTPFMEVQIGTTLIGFKCAPVRGFIQAANEIGLWQALENVNPAEREILTMLYETFKDELQCLAFTKISSRTIFMIT